ncbi:MAG: selenocysteine-specific translation elongation factor [Anaerolineae bacterium]|nr:selenocysteine-specific translation elongation factor [Anaerolineae bacterium]
MHVIGTAGHVDHGKSTLVEALTGIDPDRLREEKEREMTIVLGFAWLTLPNGEPVGVIDVPGHKDFIRNMLSGVGGIDAALLVIAADEGIMPQTREHLAILDLLQVRSGVIALTKADLVDDSEWIDLVSADVMDEVEGTCMEDAPIVPVSAHTGEGLDRLVEELQRVLERTPGRADVGRPRLPIDRAFTISGFGTVVTGTLIDGSLRLGQEVEIVPAGHTARIRGLQTHMEKIEEAVPGSRVAINLTGVSTEDLTTGDVVTVPGWLKPTLLADVQLRYLASAPRALKHNVEVDFFCGSAEIAARVRLLGADTLPPGESGWAQIRFSQPVALVRGDRFILRQLSPSVTIGGGVVIDPAPRRRHRRFRTEVIERLETLAHGTPEEIVLQALEQEQPQEVRALVARVSLPVDQAVDAVRALLGDGRVMLVDGLEDDGRALQNVAGSARYLVSSFGWRELVARMQAALVAYHREHPLRQGMPREELRSRLQERNRNIGGRLFNQLVARAQAEGAIDGDAASVWHAEHRVAFSGEQRRAVDELLAQFARDPYMTPSAAECVSALGEELFSALLEDGTLVRISADVVYTAQTLREMEDRVVAYLREHGSATVAQVRDLFGASRKYIVSLMEYLDQTRVTRRVGDERVLRERQAPQGEEQR